MSDLDDEDYYEADLYVASMELEVCTDCGKPEGSFACKIRHVQLNTGWAKSAND